MMETRENRMGARFTGLLYPNWDDLSPRIKSDSNGS